jgi:acetyl-CoA C-acetyltransferase
MIYEIYKQMQGKAEPQERQIRRDLKLGLTHNLGGLCGSTVVSVAIFGREL